MRKAKKILNDAKKGPHKILRTITHLFNTRRSLYTARDFPLTLIAKINEVLDKKIASYGATPVISEAKATDFLSISDEKDLVIAMALACE